MVIELLNYLTNSIHYDLIITSYDCYILPKKSMLWPKNINKIKYLYFIFYYILILL